MEVGYLGNTNLLKRHKTAFLCSRTVGSRAVMCCYDWATEMVETDTTVIGGFQSKIEKDVLHFLLKGNQPIILVIARQMYKELPDELCAAMQAGRLLIISTAPKAVRVSKEAANTRNNYIAEVADDIVFGYINKDSYLNIIYDRYKIKSKLLSK